MTRFHTPVLLNESLEYLNIKKREKYLDATVGGGGHTEAILQKGGQVLGIDFDPEAIKVARERFLQACPNASWHLAQGNFKNLRQIAQKQGYSQVAGVLFDLGVSSHQLESAGHGFSFSLEGPLDMRMDPELKVSAADLINGLSKGELNELFVRLGQEKYSRFIAAAIVSARRLRLIKTTSELAALVADVYRQKTNRRPRLHPATKVFLALRIAVNQEFDNLKRGLAQAVEILKPGGRLVVISFHSGEDRIVKQFLRQEPSLKILTKKPIRPTEQEVKKNPRSRSAKLRAGEKNEKKL